MKQLNRQIYIHVNIKSAFSINKCIVTFRARLLARLSFASGKPEHYKLCLPPNVHGVS